MRFHSPAPEALRAAAGELARALGPQGLVLGLCGGLGVGKTEFVKGLGEALGIDAGLIRSPTFAIANLYPGPGVGRPGLVHVDFFRIASEAELETAGWLDWLEPGAVVAVEWADRWPSALPADHLRLRIARSERGPGRSVEACATGAASGTVLSRWRESLVRSGEVDPEAPSASARPGGGDRHSNELRSNDPGRAGSREDGSWR